MSELSIVVNGAPRTVPGPISLAGLLEHLEVLHDTEAAHLEALLERAQRLAVLPEELVEQAPSGGVGEGPEHRVHAADDR